MDARIVTLLKSLGKCPGASEEALERLREYAGADLPADYLDFLRWSNGAEGFMRTADGEGPYLALYSAEEIPGLTDVGKPMHPGCLRIGGSGDSTFSLLIDTATGQPETMAFLQFDPYGEGDGIEYRASSFSSLLDHLSVWEP